MTYLKTLALGVGAIVVALIAFVLLKVVFGILGGLTAQIFSGRILVGLAAAIVALMLIGFLRAAGRRS